MKSIHNITAVVTTFNDSKNIIPFIENVSKQTILPDKMIIVDGGSKDDTVAVIENYALNSKFEIEVISDSKRRNIAEGINTGIKLSSTDWVLILGTGNSYNPEMIAEFISYRTKSASQVFYSAIIGVNDTKFGYIFNQYFLRGNRIQDLDASNHAVLIHKNVLQANGYFWEKFIYAGEDFEFFARLRKNGVALVYVKEAISFWDTPQNWKEYNKKMRVNSIADWQIEKKSKILRKCYTELFMLLVFVFLVIKTPLSLFLLPFVLIIFSFKKKTSNIIAVLLGLYNRYLMIYYYSKNYKYSDEKYHFNVNETFDS
jgi:GT2 family glycosyltransferase